MFVLIVVYDYCMVPVSVAHWVNVPLLIGHSACWADGLRALAGLVSSPGLEGGSLA